MLTLYTPKETTFTHNGLGIIHATQATVTEELNSVYELEVKCTITKELERVRPYLMEFYIIKAPTPTGKQLFRIYDVNKNLSGEITLKARHIYYDLLYSFVDGVKGENTTIDAAIKSIYQNTATSHSFTVSSNITNLINYEFIDANPINAVLGDSGLIALAGLGELKRDNYNIKLLDNIGQDRGFIIRYGKNLTGLDIHIDTDGMATRVKPIAQDSEGNPLYLPEKYIDSPFVNNYFMPICGKLEYSDIRVGSEEYADATAAYTEMRRRVNEFYMTGGDKPKFNAKIQFILLRKTAEYSQFAPLEEIYLGDTVTIIHNDLGLDMTAKCIKYTYDSMLERYINIELGEPLGDFTVNAGREISRLQSAVSSRSSSGSDVSTIVNDVNAKVEDIYSKLTSHAHTGADGTTKINKSNLVD